MTMLESPNSLLEHLERLRRRLRLMLVLHGMGRCSAILLGAALALVFIDYAVHFPGAVRLILSILTVMAGIALICKWVVLPALRPLSNRFLASRLEDSAGLTQEELLTAVEFLETDAAKKNILAAKTIDHATQVSQTLNPSRATTWRSVNRWWITMLVVILAGAVCGLMHPDRAKIACLRWADPLGLHEWPLYCEAHFVWNISGTVPPALWPRGEPLTLQATVIKGFYPEMEVWLYCRQDGQDIAPVLMTWQGKDHGTLFEKILLPQGDQLEVRVRAGDDNQEPWIPIKIVPRPRFVSLRAEIEAPPYAAGVPAYNVDLSQNGLRVIQGSRVVVNFQSDQPVSLSPGAIRLTTLDANSTAAFGAAPVVKVTGENEGEATFVARQSFIAALFVRDAQGLKNREGGVFQVNVAPDALPTVEIIDPSHSVDLTPDGHLNVQIQAQDDLGLTQIYLAGHKSDAKAGEPPLFQTALTWDKLVYDPATRSSLGQAHATWPPAEENLGVGDSVVLQAVVGDNYRVLTADGQVHTHPLVFSAGVLVNIRSRDEIQSALRSDLEGVRHSIEMLLAAQQQTADATLAIERSIAATGKATPGQIATLADLAAAQSGEAARAQAIRQTLEQIQQIAQNNGLQDSPEGKLSAQAADLMQQAGRQNMAPAAVNLNQSSQLAQNPGTVSQAGAKLGHAHPQQQTAIQILQQLLDQLGEEGQFATLKARLMQIIQQQAAQEAQLRDLAGQTLGQDVSALPPDLAAKLHDLAQRQGALSKSVEQLVNDLHSTAQDVQNTNPAMAQTLSNTANIAETYLVSQDMTLAGQSIDINQVESAGDQQKQAATGLQAMLDEMNKYDQRSLDERRQQLENLIQLVKKLIVRQTAVNQTTAQMPANAPATALSPLADLQSHLQLDTLAAAGQARQADPTGPSSGDLHDASDAMGSATGDLLRAQQPQAKPDQKAALDGLNKALADLQKALNDVLRQQQLQTLQDIEAMYKTILTQQQNLLQQSQTIAADLKARGELTRREFLQLQTMSTTESRLIDDLNAISQRLSSAAPLLVWMNQGIIEAITQAKGQMDQASVDQLLIGDEQYSIQMIQAIMDALEKQITSTKQGGSGGSGGGGGPLIPPTAQLELLRTLQTQINAKTLMLNNMYTQTTDPDQRSEIQQGIHDLGVIQDQLRQEAQKVIQSMQSGT